MQGCFGLALAAIQAIKRWESVLHAEDMAVVKVQRRVLIRSEWGVRVL